MILPLSPPPPFPLARLNVLIDPNNSGSWTDCASTDLSSLPSDWLNKAYVGITASTGQLADNHDVLSLLAFSDHEVMDQVEEAKKKEKAFPTGEKETLDDRLARYVIHPQETGHVHSSCRMEIAINSLMEKGEFLDHHVEHALASIDDHIANMIGKLEKREDKSESRIGDLESVSSPMSLSMSLLISPRSLRKKLMAPLKCV